ncbi:MAG: T9SS type A sorting domain-containing protein, partial [Saprospiraceae bacterium]|nr:T9SS type A sorting domain-containing protein [Saprospiraceae bacterium]
RADARIESYSDDIQLFGIDYNITAEIRIFDPTCPQKKDGEVRMNVFINGRNALGIEDVKLDITKYSIGGRISQTVVDQNLFVGLSEGIYSTEIKRNGQIVLFKIIELNGNPTYSIFLDKERSQNETCPGIKDGKAVIKVVIDEVPSLQWNNIEELTPIITITPPNITSCFTAAERHAGTYPINIRVNNGDNLCCATGTVNINTNYCPQSTYTYTGGIPNDWFMIPSGVVQSNGSIAEFQNDGCVYIPFEVDFNTAQIIALSFEYSGEGTAEIIDGYTMISITEDSLSGPGHARLNIKDPKVDHYYVKLTFNKNSSFSDLLVDTYSDYNDLKLELKSDEITELDKSLVIQNYCIGDVVYPYDGFTFSGGISPFDFKWALDGDMVFDDADSLLHPIIFDTEGIHDIALMVEDHIGDRDTLTFKYNAMTTTPYTIGVPNLGVSQSLANGLIVCKDSDSFDINVEPNAGQLISDSDGLSGNTFDPKVAGQGSHLVYISANDCDDQAYINIDVIDFDDPVISIPSTIYPCDEILELDEFLTSEFDGFWILDNASIIENAELNPETLVPGIHNLSYGFDFGGCEIGSELSFELLPPPTINLLPFTDSITNMSPPIDLNTLLSSGSTSGGTWSGGSYVQAGLFNPEGLTPGFYDVTYTVGEGSCEVFSTIQIEVQLGTSGIYKLSNLGISYYPNPVHNELVVCVDNLSSLDSKKVSILDSQGKLINENSFNKSCIEFDIKLIPNGLYFIRYQDSEGHNYVGKIIKL